MTHRRDRQKTNDIGDQLFSRWLGTEDALTHGGGGFAALAAAQALRRVPAEVKNMGPTLGPTYPLFGSQFRG